METQNLLNIQPYQRLAAYYDQLMDYIDYDIWVADIEELTKSFKSDSKWLDISCGTGSMALRLARLGRNMTAVDLSPHMIDIAAAKAKSDGVQINFQVGDMLTFNNNEHYDVIINLHDGLNYLLTTTDIQVFLANTFALLKPGGVLLFDVVTPLLCQTHFRGYREIFNDDQGGYERYTNYDPITQLAESIFTLQTNQDDTSEVETHIQKAYELSDVEGFCRDSKFKSWQILDDESMEAGDAESERYLVRLIK
ncbi:class I SAM-dependent methyltransferase [bacterium]|nr:class I SAM-dependent methyltransferase [bacterium]